MNEVWNLDRMYTGFDDPKYQADFEAFEEKIAEFSAFTRELDQVQPLEGLRKGIQLKEELDLISDALSSYPHLRAAANTKDTEAVSQSGRIMGVYSNMAGANAVFRQWVCEMPNLMELVAQDDFLKDYTFFFNGMKDMHRYDLSPEASQVSAKLRLSGGSAWGKLQSYLTSTVPVFYRGTTTNLSAIRNLAYDEDPQVRKDAYEAELACYESIKEPVAHALNAIKLETISTCQLCGYESPLAMTLKRSDMEKATLDAMLGAMDEYLPKFWQYLRVKAKVLGHENGLPWYDLFAPLGKASSSFTTEQARDFLLERFAAFDQDLTDMVRTAFDDAWIDFYPRDGKRGGAFCASIHAIGESRILTNYDGMFTDVVTLAHELGHAFHNRCIHDHRPLNRGYSMPVAETASTFNECVVMNAAIKAAKDKDEKIALIESQLQDATQIICDIYSRFRFEDAVFTNRQSRFMNADALCGMMLEAQKQCYGDGLDHNCLHPFMWACKSHYYGPTYYNFPYAFGGLFARGLYAQYEKEGAAFVPKYKKLLHTTTVATAEDTAKVVGIDLTDKTFWRTALQTIAAQVDMLCELLEG